LPMWVTTRRSCPDNHYRSLEQEPTEKES
jgi:hypothetical protein